MSGDRMVEVWCIDCGCSLVRRATRATGTIRCHPCATKVAGEKRRRRVQRTCKACGETFEAQRSEVARGHAKFCSRACSYKVSRIPKEHYERLAARLSIERRGAGNPAWKGKDTEGSIYRVFNVGLKGEEACRNCGSTQRPLHLHHIVPRSMCKAGRRDMRNGVTLCASCHAGWHHRTTIVYRDVLTAEEWEFVSSLELLGQEIAAWLDDRYPAREADRAA